MSRHEQEGNSRQINPEVVRITESQVRKYVDQYGVDKFIAVSKMHKYLEVIHQQLSGEGDGSFRKYYEEDFVFRDFNERYMRDIKEIMCPSFPGGDSEEKLSAVTEAMLAVDSIKIEDDISASG